MSNLNSSGMSPDDVKGIPDGSVSPCERWAASLGGLGVAKSSRESDGMSKLDAWLAKYGTTTFDTILGFILAAAEDNTLRDDALTMSDELRQALDEYVKLTRST